MQGLETRVRLQCNCCCCCCCCCCCKCKFYCISIWQQDFPFLLSVMHHSCTACSTGKRTHFCDFRSSFEAGSFIIKTMASVGVCVCECVCVFADVIRHWTRRSYGLCSSSGGQRLVPLSHSFSISTQQKISRFLRKIKPKCC